MPWRLGLQGAISASITVARIRFSFVCGDGSCTSRGAIISRPYSSIAIGLMIPGLEILNGLAQFLQLHLRVIVCQVEISSPVGRIKAPMARTILAISVRVAHKLCRAEQALAFKALDAPR